MVIHAVFDIEAIIEFIVLETQRLLYSVLSMRTAAMGEGLRLRGVQSH